MRGALHEQDDVVLGHPLVYYLLGVLVCYYQLLALLEVVVRLMLAAESIGQISCRGSQDGSGQE